MTPAHETSDLLTMLREAASHSVQHDTPVTWSPGAFKCFVIEAHDGRAWRLSHTAYAQGLSQLGNPVLVEILRRAMMTLEGRGKLLEAALSSARQRSVDPSVWGTLVA